MSLSFCPSCARRYSNLLKGEKMRKPGFPALRKENEDAWERAWSNVLKEVEKVRWVKGSFLKTQESFQK